MGSPSRKVGIRELKAHLSRVVREASQGQCFAVTEHGNVVAELGPPTHVALTSDDVRARVVGSGGRKAERAFDLPLPERTADWQAIDVGGLLDELRGER